MVEFQEVAGQVSRVFDSRCRSLSFARCTLCTLPLLLLSLGVLHSAVQAQEPGELSVTLLPGVPDAESSDRLLVRHGPQAAISIQWLMTNHTSVPITITSPTDAFSVHVVLLNDKLTIPAQVDWEPVFARSGLEYSRLYDRATDMVLKPGETLMVHGFLRRADAAALAPGDYALEAHLVTDNGAVTTQDGPWRGGVTLSTLGLSIR